MGPVVGRRVVAGAVALSILAGCGSDVNISVGGGGSGGAGGETTSGVGPEPDPCLMISVASCCDAGCEIVDPPPEPGRNPAEPLCVSAERLCYHRGDCREPLEKECEPGYECVHFAAACPSTCTFSGEFDNTEVGYCIWMSK